MTKKHDDFGTEFVMDFNDFRGFFGSIFEYLFALFQKFKKASKPLFFVWFLKVFACKNHPKYPPKYNLENERPKSVKK